jgi:GTP-binding protein LepA
MSNYDISRIRNFSIIAHIDHGKSTLSDRIIQVCGGLEEREMQDQVLDNMELEKERGITIKSQTVRLRYKSKKDGEEYILNLMDTPGHVDFGYEVSRCLAACEGSVLVVDASQGVEAQTLANVYKAMDVDNELVIALNKIDLPAADPDKVKAEIEDVIGLDASEAKLVSAKAGLGIEDLIEEVIAKIPAPQDGLLRSEKHAAEISKDNLKCLLVDAWYDTYLGVIILVRVVSGTVKRGDRIKMLNTGGEYDVEGVGFFTPKKQNAEAIYAGEVGFINANIKNVADCFVGDTIVGFKDATTKPLAGFKKPQQVVFCGLYPLSTEEFDELSDAINKLALNDSSFSFEKESSSALGLGFRCGFLGLLHMEIVQERLFREFNIELITTAPSVVYKMLTNKGEEQTIYNPLEMPDPVYIKKMEEPWIKATIFTPEEYLGAVLKLCTDKRGEQAEMGFSGQGGRIKLVYKIPLNEVVFDFYDRLKSISSGYASFEWEMDEYREGDLCKLSILVNGEPLNELSLIVNKASAERRGRALCEKLKELIPRQMFKVAIQAAIGAKIVARETIDAFRKDVLAKCYGGDVTRKKKLLEKQKKGKKRMKEIGNIEIPHSVFVEALKVDGD